MNASRHLHPHIVCIPSFLPRALLNDPLLERLSYLPLELPSLRSSDFGTLILLDTNPKAEVSNHQLMLGYNTLPRYHLTV